MARRRVISSAMLVDERFNRLSIEEQIVFLRLLSISDDFGITPGNEAELGAMLNLPDELRRNLNAIILRIVEEDLGHLLTLDGKRFFCFRPRSFKYWQAQLIVKRKRSEYLRLSDEEVMKLFSEQIQPQPEDFRTEPKTSELNIESRKKKEDSSDEKAVSRGNGSGSAFASEPPVFSAYQRGRI